MPASNRPDSNRIVSFTIGPNPAPRLDKALAQAVPEAESLSRSRLAKLITEGAVRIGGRVASDLKARVEEGDEIVINVEISDDIGAHPEDIELDIVFEDEELLVVNKPAGMVVHPAPGTPTGTLVNALLHHLGDELSGVGGEKRPGIVHRIDKDTSGLLVVAKTDRAHHGLAAQFADHSIEREYLALCFGVPDASDPRLRGVKGVSFEGNRLKLTTQLARHKHDRQRQAVVFSGGKHAVTRAEVLEALGSVALLACRLETGRTHQIRVHLAHAGHALVGDQTYAARRKVASSAIGADAINRFARQALHAARLGFVHPTTKAELTFEAPLPSDLEQLLMQVRHEATPRSSR